MSLDNQSMEYYISDRAFETVRSLLLKNDSSVTFWITDHY